MLMRVQAELLELVKEIDGICKKHHIPYYLGGGCLVGAIRNSGFLPWDDDVDIHMTRDDAKRFLSYSGEFPVNREIMCYETDNDAPTVLWRYMDTTKTVYMRSTFFRDSAAGLFVDIFIMDPVYAKDEESVEDYEYQRELFYELCCKEWFVDTRYDRAFFADYEQYRMREKEIGFENLHKLFEKKIYSGTEEDGNYYLIRTPTISVKPFPKYMWGNPRYVPFEDILLPVPEKAEELLQFAYGNKWMETPLPTERGFHVFLSDDRIPYTVVKDDFNNFINRDKIREFHQQRKEKIIKYVPDRNETNPEMYQINSGIVVSKIKANIEKNNLNLDDLVKTLDIKSLERIFADYYTVQFKKNAFYQVYIEMPDIYLYPAMVPLVYRGKSSQAFSILKMRKSNQIPLDEKLSELYVFLSDMEAITECLYVHKDYVKASLLVSRYIDDYNWVVELCRDDIRIKLHSEISPTEIRTSVERYLSRFPRDGELLKYKADILKRATEKDEEAHAAAYKALGTIRNGLEKTSLTKQLMESMNGR